jgi:hypothetical protein
LTSMNAQAAQDERATSSVDLKQLIPRFASEVNILYNVCLELLPYGIVPGQFREINDGCTPGLPHWRDWIQIHASSIIEGDTSAITEFRKRGVGNLLSQEITSAQGPKKVVVKASCYELLDLYEGKNQNTSGEAKITAGMLRSVSKDQVKELRFYLEKAKATYGQILDCWKAEFGPLPDMEELPDDESGAESDAESASGVESKANSQASNATSVPPSSRVSIGDHFSGDSLSLRKDWHGW